MSDNEQDTHFQAFAEALERALHFSDFALYHAGKSNIEVKQARCKIITTHNRKLVEYVLLSVECIDFDRLTIQEHVAKIVEHFADYENNSWHPPTP